LNAALKPSRSVLGAGAGGFLRDLLQRRLALGFALLLGLGARLRGKPESLPPSAPAS
jgi:hypothetical protein